MNEFISARRHERSGLTKFSDSPSRYFSSCNDGDGLYAFTPRLFLRIEEGRTTMQRENVANNKAHYASLMRIRLYVGRIEPTFSRYLAQ